MYYYHTHGSLFYEYEYKLRGLCIMIMINYGRGLGQKKHRPIGASVSVGEG